MLMNINFKNSKRYITLSTICLLILTACRQEDKKARLVHEESTQTTPKKTDAPFMWESANVYFLLVDRFMNGNTTNDRVLKRTKKTGVLRGFTGGDLQGIIQKIKEGYFQKLGINALWFNPVVEQIHGSVDEGTGNTYAFHGYWAKDWTNIDPNFGTYADLKELVDLAHQNGIRILMDVVINHTGPVTKEDPAWPADWVRTDPQCDYTNYQHTVACTLVKNLPDIKTESDKNVALPPFLIEKWKAEERLTSELQELDAFFDKTGLKKSPQNYIIKWLTDYVRELGIDGFRVDTVKHVDEDVWAVLAEQAKLAFREWKSLYPEKVLDAKDFYMLGEVYNYGIHHKRRFDFGDQKVDYFAHGFDNLINFSFKFDAKQLSYEQLFDTYSTALKTNLIGKGVMNYISSHDDGTPFDKDRSSPYEAATKLLLSPGTAQIYYGDEIARPLQVEGAIGDATLRSEMEWTSLTDPKTKDLLDHWQKLGQFRKAHPAVGAGAHKMISESPYLFSRKYTNDGNTDTVIIGLNLPKGKKTIPVKGLFPEGTIVKDAYSSASATVINDQLTIDSDAKIVLLAPDTI